MNKLKIRKKMVKKEVNFEKVVKWEGKYDYINAYCVLLIFNIIFCLIAITLSWNHWSCLCFIFWLAVNIFTALIGFLDLERKVYWRRVNGKV